MGAFDVYCVICGATTTEIETGPREQPEDDEYDEYDEDVYMENRYDEDAYVENKYDADVIGDEDMEWFRQARLLCFNPDAPGANKFFVSGAGEYLDGGIFDVDEGSEPDSAIEDFDLGGVKAWGDCGGRRGFPFHRQCYTLLARVLTGTEDTGKINKAVLYKIFSGLVSWKSRCSDLDYGDATQGQDQTWEAIPGCEYTVINPERRESLVGDILEVIQDEKFVETPSNLNLGNKVRWDPFQQVPESLLRDILDLLDHESMLNLCRASWGIFNLTRYNRRFWESRIHKNMPYFEELGETITTRRESLRGQDLRKILLWAEEASKPRVGISGFLMAVANRRRIWGVCEQIARRYHAECPDPDSKPRYKMESIAVCNKMHFVSLNVNSVVLDIQRSYWIRSWDEYDADRPWTLKTFWNSDWDMTGISVGFGGEEPRMFGKRGTEEGAWETSKEVASDTWIRGFVFHLWPTNSLLEWEHSPSWNYISVKGITIYFYDGFPVSYGDTGDSLMQRPLFAAEDMVIVGVEGQFAEKEDVTPWILRFGLLQAYPGDEEKPDPGYYPEIRNEEQMSWSSASLTLLDKPIWESESLKFVCDDFGRIEINFDREVIPLRILMLGNRPNELANIRSISACTNSIGMCERDNKRCFSNAVTNVRVSFADGQQTRTMREVDEDGFSWPEENWEEFEIDGPGGEIIDEIGWLEAYDRYPQHLYLRTNRNRTVLFALDTLADENNTNTRIKLTGLTVDNDYLRVLKAEEGDVIVGIVMGFGQRESDDWLPKSDMEEFGIRPWTYETFQKRSETELFSYFSFVGALTMAKDD